MEGKGVGQWLLRLTPVYLLPQKKSPHGLHHLLGYDRLPSPQTSWSGTLRGHAHQTRQGARALRGSVCRKAVASDTLHFTRASCQVAFDASNTTLTLLGLELQLPRCTFCSLADALEAQSAGVPAPGKPAHALPRAAAPQAVRAAGAAGCHRARGRARRRGAAGRAIAGGERDGRRRGRAPRRRAPGARRDAAPARGARWSARARG